ncbi:MAG: DUF3667 domain-containing protein [Flavobacteriales bacterium]|nr:DUF3667 domain-containing protein [Flavobacteriales bacterium]
MGTAITKSATTDEAPACLNCGSTLGPDARYCAHCGQATVDQQRPVTALVGELLTSLFSLDAKLWSTLGLLLFKPGQLTARYLAGRRRAQVPPLRLYLFISLVYFILTGVQVDRQFRKLAEDESLGPGQALQETDTLNFLDLQVTVSGARQAALMTPAQRDSMLLADGHEPNLLNRFMLSRAPRLADLNGIERLTVRTLQYFSYALFILMPVLGFVLWLFFKRARPWYFDHLIHSIHLHAFYFFFQSVFLALRLFLGFSLGSIGLIAILIYLPVSLRMVYGRRWPATLGLSIPVMLLQSLVIGVAFLASGLCALILL